MTLQAELKSYSKINFGLWVKEKRPDNFHEIETIYFENENLYDNIEINFVESKDHEIKVHFLQKEFNDLIPEKENIVYKACELFFNKLGVTGKCRVIIDKKIPLKAGLGGGSSNAASVLKVLNQIFKNKLNQNILLKLSNELGSDVPFFIIGKTCLGKGKGETLTPLVNKLKLDVKIDKPKDISISTKLAYEKIDSRKTILDHREQIQNLIHSMEKSDYDLFCNNLFNDFEEIIFSSYPQLIEEKGQLLKEGHRAVHLCGSGSALFGIK